MNQHAFLFKSGSDPRPTFGVIVPFFWAGKSIALLQGIYDAALYFKANILIFQGHYSSHADYYHKDKGVFDITGMFVFKLIDKCMLDGLIIQTGAFRTHTDKLRVLEFCDKFKPLPMINIGSAIDGITDVLIDNENGIANMMDHLILHHSYRKIALIRGPEKHFDSDERLNAYLKMLRKYSIPLNDKWISPPGVWNDSWAGTAVIELLKSVNLDIDAILCMSDWHARDIINTLQHRGIRVPQQIAVVGFNDSTDAQACVPAITTVQLNLYDRGWFALATLIEAHCGMPLPDTIKVDAPLVIRQSCGCCTPGTRTLNVFSDEQLTGTQDASQSKEGVLHKAKIEISAKLKITNNDKIFTLVVNFINCFINEIGTSDKSRFIKGFSKILHEYIQDNQDPGNWYPAINVICHYAKQLVTDNAKNKIDDLANIARLLLSEISENEQDLFLRTVQERNTLMNSLNKKSINISSISELVEIFAENLPATGIPACYLSLYENNENPLDKSRLVLAFNENGRINLPAEGISFPTLSLIPEHIITIEQFKPLIIEPLFHSQHQIGFVLFKYSVKERSFYELFPTQLSALLWSVMLVQKEQENEQVLEIQAKELINSNEKLRKRSKQLNLAYRQLVSNQQALLHSEKMASLGKLTAGIAHEMNTPLATVRASLSELKSLVAEYSMSINDAEISFDDHKQIAREILNAASLAERAISSASRFVQSISFRTTEQEENETMQFDLVTTAQNVIKILNHLLVKTDCKTIIKSSHAHIAVYGSPAQMTQVFVNLLSNAIEAVSSAAERVITVELVKNDSSVVIHITDTGCGITKENLGKIYDPMFTTKQFGQGTGLGLSIVRDIICKAYGGTIMADSTPGSGTKFTLKIDSIPDTDIHSSDNA